ncbi:MAG TPA: electron transfer flavoprotein subunit beta/FixA family protein [Streptosporangiaceae bacterium]|nr:electron transfer flavoprotein subunit beta/FixA family protein [Streptosporangiaceae bacterium]
MPIKAVPDLVEEIELTADETGIDREFLAFVVSEWDAQALEEALLIKDANGAEVVAAGLASDPDIDQALYTAIAKGADAAVKITGGEGEPVLTGERAALLASYLASEPADLVVTGVQAADDLDGQLPPMLAARLGWPHVSVVVGIAATDGAITARQEFAGGRVHELAVRLPAVIGVQAARQAPRYAPISRVRQAMQAGGLREVAAEPSRGAPAPVVRRMFRPERTSRAEMLTGSTDDVAEAIVGLLRGRGLVKG